MDPAILRQIPVMERALVAAGFTVWPMVEYEADDALGAAAAVADADERVSQVLIVTPDKDLRTVRTGRPRRASSTGASARSSMPTRFAPSSGWDPSRSPTTWGSSATRRTDSRVSGVGAKSAGLVLARYGHLEQIPAAAGQWDVTGLRGAAKLSATLRAQFADAVLFREIATVATDIDVGTVDDWRWSGPTEEFAAVASEIGAPELVAFAQRLAP